MKIKRCSIPSMTMLRQDDPSPGRRIGPTEADIEALSRKYQAELTKTRKQNPDQRHRAVRIVETGEVFPSQVAAAHRLGCGKHAVSAAIRRGNRVAGFNVEAVDAPCNENAPTGQETA